MFLVDSNVLIQAADDSSPLNGPCRTLLEKWQRQPQAWFVTWGICFEFLRVVTHKRALRNPWPIVRAWSFIQALLQAPALTVLTPTERHAEVLRDIFASMPFLGGNDVHDTRIAAFMREHGVRTIYTRDMGFHRFPFLEVIDPTTLS